MTVFFIPKERPRPMFSPHAVSLVRLPHAQDLPLPQYATEGSSGVDLHAAVTGPLVLLPNTPTLVPSGIAIALPQGLEAQVRPRSGLALRHGITCLNSPGTVDSDYRGEINALLINLSQQNFTINRGDRIAQLVFCPIIRVYWEEVSSLDTTKRGQKGFGSSGVAAA